MAVIKEGSNWQRGVMDYKIIDRDKEVERIRKGRPIEKWHLALENLPYNKAIQSSFPSKEEAKRLGKNLSGYFRKPRSSFLIRYRTRADAESWILYVWKEERAS